MSASRSSRGRGASLLLFLLLGSTPLRAQGIFAGVLVDPKLKTPLPCVDVALEDSAAHEVAHARTASDGAFQFDSLPTGSYRPRFDVFQHRAAYGAFETLDPTSDRARVYQIDFGPSTTTKQKFWPDTSDSPPKPTRIGKAFRYPPELRAASIEGEVRVRFVVDSAGRVVQPTIHVLGSTHADFTSEVLRYLGAAQFEPARRAGQAVCAIMIDAPFTFSIERGR